MKRDYDEVLSEYGISAYDETSQGAAMTQREESNADQKKLTWLLGLEKETLANMAHQQAKIIEKLQKAAKAQAVPQWISVSDRLPEEEGTYFCLGHNGTAFVCLFRATKYEGKIWLRSTGTKRIYGITHWMPLPAAPEQNK